MSRLKAVFSGAAVFSIVFAAAIMSGCGSATQRDGGIVPPDSGLIDAGGDAGGGPADDAGPDAGDASPADSGTDSGDDASQDSGQQQDAGGDAGDAGTDAGPDAGKLASFGSISITYSQTNLADGGGTGYVQGSFYGWYKPGKYNPPDGGGGGWTDPDAGECVVVKPKDPCGPPDCTPAEFQLVSVGDVTISGFFSGVITLKKNPASGYYYPDGDPLKASIDADEFQFESTYQVDGAGMPPYGSFSEQVDSPAMMKIYVPADCGAAKLLPMDKDLEVQWAGADGENRYMTFSVVETPGNKYWSLFCKVQNTGQFTIPAKYMIQLPSSVSSQQLYISKSNSAMIDIPGMDYGYFNFMTSAVLTCVKP